jgi:chromosomal replication initiator protein
LNEGTILVVDDDPLVLRLIEASLARGGFEVVLAADGEEGFQAVLGEHPDLIISDIMMPKVDGFELARMVRADPLVSSTPIVMLSAKTEEEDIIKGFELGADDYITKPFSPRQLVARIGAILRRRETIRGTSAPSAGGPFASEGLERLGALRFENFVVGDGNRQAFDAASAAAETPGTRFNPLFLYGGPGLGKTHLMCALANAAYGMNPEVRVLYLTSEHFSEQLLAAFESRSINELRNRYLSADVFLIDDIQFLAISPSTQAIAAETFSTMYENGKQIVVSSDRKPEDLHALTSEISSGFAFGLVVQIQNPNRELRKRILRQKATQQQWPLDEELLDYLADRLSSDVRTLEGAALKLIAMKNLSGVPIDRPLIDDVVAKLDADESYASASRGSADVPLDSDQRAELEPEPTVPQLRNAPEEPVLIAPATQKYPDPVAIEFSRSNSVTRVLGSPEQVALDMPKTGARPAVVMGTSKVLVVDTVDALAGKSAHSSRLPDGDRWAYMVHVDGADPRWILFGMSEWSTCTDLADEVERSYAPVFLVILDGKSPKLSEARELVETVPDGVAAAVVVLANVDSEERDRVETVLSGSMRRLFRVPERIPVVVASGVETIECRSWLRRALAGN